MARGKIRASGALALFATLLLTLLAGCALPPLPLPDTVPAQRCVAQRQGTLGAGGGVIVPLTALDPTSAHHTSALYGVRASNGAIAWSCASTTYAGWGDAQVYNGVLYAIAGTEPTKDAPARTHVHAIYAIRPYDGAQIWSYSFRAGTTSRLTFDGGMIFVSAISTDGASSHSNLYAIHAATGALAWEASFSDAIGQPIIVSHRILAPSAASVTSAGQTLLAIDESDGSTTWSASLPTKGSPVAWLVQGSALYLSDGSALIAVDGATGAIRWTQQAVDSVTSSLFSAQGAILFSARMSVLAFDAKTGALRWSAVVGAAPQLVAVRDQVAYAVTQGPDGALDTLFALDASSGDVLWQRDAASASAITPGQSGDAYLVSVAGTMKLGSVVALDPHGRARWIYNGSSPFPAGALISTSAALYYVWQDSPSADTQATYITCLRPTDGAALWTTALPALNAYALPPLLAS
jgi:outer membrane protein assembly factor BamB